MSATAREAAGGAQLVRRTARADNDTELEYYVYPAGLKTPRRTIVYIHGLISDVNWFRVPEDMPPDTSIVFLPRQPRIQVDRFETWVRNYECCLADFKSQHQCETYHLIAQCFGVFSGAYWAMLRPETFATVTLVCPPIEVRNKFGILKSLSILLGPEGGLQHCELTPRSYGRSPALIRFISENPTTRYEFTNALYRQTLRLKRTLMKELIAFPVPTHVIITTDDEIAGRPIAPKSLHGLPDRISVICSDHFCELLPSAKEFWQTVFAFQQDHEGRFCFGGDIETVLVTGATGFLGSHIVRKLHADGRHIVIYARSANKAKKMFADLEERVTIAEGNLDDLAALEQALEGVDAIVHTAGHVSDWDSFASFEHTNVELTKNVLLLAHERGLRHFVHISSLGVFGDTDQDNIDENNMYRWSSDHYSNTKILSEVAVRKYCTINRIPFSIIRPGFIYGEGDNNFLPRLIDNLEAGKVKFVGTRENYLNTVYVGNVAEMVAAVLGNPKAMAETYNAADPQHTTIGHFIGDVARGLDLEVPTKVAPKGVALTSAAIMERVFRLLRAKKPPPLTRKKVTFAARSRSINASKAYALLGRKPYSYEEGMKRTLASLRS
jgi:nucleoside-diphosphate-sugar epimerase